MMDYFIYFRNLNIIMTKYKIFPGEYDVLMVMIGSLFFGSAITWIVLRSNDNDNCKCNTNDARLY